MSHSPGRFDRSGPLPDLVVVLPNPSAWFLSHAGEIEALVETDPEVVGIDEDQFFNNELVEVVNET